MLVIVCSILCCSCSHKQDYFSVSYSSIFKNGLLASICHYPISPHRYPKPEFSTSDWTFESYSIGYDQFGISRKGPEDTSDEHCTIFYDKEKV